MVLAGKVAVVTGASSGIGLAAMKALSKHGAYVFAIARDSEKLKKANDAVHADFRENVMGHIADVRDEAAVKQAVDHALTTFGKVDILINAAGVSMSEGQFVQHIKFDEWNRIMETNLNGTFLMCREVLTGMLEHDSGYIINILSTSAFQASAGSSLYAASKFGARALTEALISAHRRSGIRVSSISPGAVNTNIWDHKTKPVSQESKDTMLKVDEIAEIIMFLVTRSPDVHIEDIKVTPWYR